MYVLKERMYRPGGASVSLQMSRYLDMTEIESLTNDVNLIIK